MNHNNIFYIYKESDKIGNIIKKIPDNIDYNAKIRKYLSNKAVQFIHTHNKTLEFSEFQVYTLPFLPNYIFLVLLTKTNTNHPYGLFVNLDDIYLNFIIPYGDGRKQGDIDDYYGAIDKGTQAEIAMIYIILEKSIFIRKKALLDSKQFTLLNCNNISNCIKKKNEIAKKNIPLSDKQAIMNQYNEYYINKALDLLKRYFVLLEEKDYDEAWLFLKGKDSQYFGKERLNTFFKNTKTIIGHLEIFVYLYEMFHEARNRLLGY